MFAVIKTGGKQYKVASGDVLVVEKLAAEAGETVQFNDVLMLGGDNPAVGDPMVDGAAVQAEVVGQGRGKKIYSFKKRRRKHGSQRLKGHRQYLTTLKVTDILSSGADKTGVKTALGAASSGAMAAAAASAEPSKAVKDAEPAEKKPTKTKEAAEKKPVEADEPAAAVEGVKPGNLLDEAQGEPDDLTQISGVGPKLLTKLNENGVYHFWQIAAWGPEEISWMDDKLSFKGRIDRDGWIEQADKMSGEKTK
ncbi:MAG: 50S ribosomal protein L21 [Pseudomonadota bacterium]